MEFLSEHFYIVNTGFRNDEGYEENRVVTTLKTREECTTHIIKFICNKIEELVNSTHEIHHKHMEYFKTETCHCCKQKRMVFDLYPKTVREAKLLSQSYVYNYSINKSMFVYSIHEHPPT